MTPDEIYKLANKAKDEWFAYQNVFELYMAATAVHDLQPKVILEIGTAHGASLAVWSEVAKPELAIALDPEDIPRTLEKQTSFNNLADKYNFQRIKRYDRDPLATTELEKILAGRKIDFMFIDGAHGFDDAKFDFYTYRKYMAKDGVVGFHDITYHEVLVDAGSTCNWFFDRLKKIYEYDEFIYHSTMGIGFVYLNRPWPPSVHEI